MTALDRLAAEKYVLLTTFRKDGRAVPTPVWAVGDGDALAVWTVADSGKVKRVRRSGEVTVAPCDMRGRPRGEPVTGHATLGGPADHQRVAKLLGRKYGLVGRLSTWASRVRRGAQGTVILRIRLSD